MNKMFDRWKAVVLSFAAVLALSGCHAGGTAVSEDDSIMVIKMYGNLDETYLPFLNALSDQFPDIEFRYEYQWDEAYVNETERRLLHGDGPDLAVVSGSSMESMEKQGLLLDLTGEAFSTRYHVSAMTSLNQEGRVFGLPLPNNLKCLVANLTVLRENNINDVPQSVPELLEACEVLTENGQGAIILDSVVYDMLLSTSFLCTPSGYDWAATYNRGEGSMVGTPAADAWNRFKDFAEVSGYSSEDAMMTPAGRTQLLIDGKYAFRITDISNVKYMLNKEPKLDLAVLPLLGETREDQWVLYSQNQNTRFFVANVELDKPENTRKREAAMEVLDWISTQEAQQILAECSGAALSYVNDVELDQGNIMEYLTPVMESGHLTSSLKLARGMEETMRTCSLGILEGTITPQEAVAACDDQNQSYVPLEEISGLDEAVGRADGHIYWRKPAAVTVGSPMAQLCALSMKEAFPEADFAFAMAKNAASTMYQGEITVGDVLACSKGEGDSELMLVQATGSQIKDLISAGVGSPIEPDFVTPYGIAGAGRLLHPAGLSYKADVAREPGDKVTEITLDNGELLDLEKEYTIAVSGLMIDRVAEPNLKGCEAVPTGKYLYDVLLGYVKNHDGISPPEVGFEISGARPIYTLP